MTTNPAETHQNLRRRKRQRRNYRRTQKTRSKRGLRQRPRQTRPNRRRTTKSSHPKPGCNLHPRRRLHKNSHPQESPRNNLCASTKTDDRRNHQKAKNHSRNQNTARNAKPNHLPITRKTQQRFSISEGNRSLFQADILDFAAVFTPTSFTLA